MRAPAFWWKAPPTAAARALAPIGAIWGAVAAARLRGDGKDSGVPVICVGNFVAGGAGKTPVAIALARALIERDERPVFLSRGYGGRHGGGALRVDPARHDAARVGDEPLLLARIAPTIVCADRVAGAWAAIEAGASVVVMDDGLQNPAIAKTLSLAIVDGDVGIGNCLCLPAGPLRAPLAAQWPKVDAVVVIGRGGAGEQVAQAARANGKPVFAADLVVSPETIARLRGRKLLAFAGIGRPEKFFATLAAIGADVVETRSFADHYQFSAADIEALTRAAAARDAHLITTEKDLARLPTRGDIEALPVEIKFEDDDAIAALLQRA